MSEPFAFNPIDPAVRRDPYALYARGREIGSFRHEGLPIPLVSIFRYADVQGMLKDHELFSNQFDETFGPPSEEIRALGDPGEPSMLALDPPRHTRLRSLVNKAFTPRIVKQLEPRLREVAAQLVDEAVQKGEVDLVQALTYPLPVVAIAEIIGVPPADREQFKVWSDEAVKTLGVGFFAPPSLEDFKKQFALRDEMHAYFSALAAERRREPKDDLLTGLVQAEYEGTRLNEEEMLSMLVLLLVAGNETTTTLIGNAVLALLDHPDQLLRLRDDPSGMRHAIDEVLRFSSPVQFDPRRATAATEIAGTRIEKNELVLGWIGSANRDETVFDDGERFDARREKNPHIAFGYGTHHCLGHNLARLEAAVAVETLLAKTSALERSSTGELPLHASPVFLGYTSIPMHLEPA